jgi:hypothetical protein
MTLGDVLMPLFLVGTIYEAYAYYTKRYKVWRQLPTITDVIESGGLASRIFVSVLVALAAFDHFVTKFFL